jgi:hypothetical protein
MVFRHEAVSSSPKKTCIVAFSKKNCGPSILHELNVKKISTYKRRAGIIMIIVMSFHILAGLRLFCTDEFLASFRAYASTIASRADNPEVSDANSLNLKGKGGTLPCSCKKKKKCPAIPRAAITSNPNHQSNEFQRLAKSECRDSLAAQGTDRSFLTGGDTPFLELAVSESVHSSTPLALTCVLLI